MSENRKSVAPSGKSVASSNYSGRTESAATATQQSVKKIEGKAMTSSAEAAQERRKQNREARAEREALERRDKK